MQNDLTYRGSSRERIRAAGMFRVSEWKFAVQVDGECEQRDGGISSLLRLEYTVQYNKPKINKMSPEDDSKQTFSNQNKTNGVHYDCFAAPYESCLG